MSTTPTAELRPGTLEELRAIVQAEVDAGLDGAQLAVGLGGAVVFSEGFGAAERDTPIVLMSPTKTVLDSGIWQLLGDGRIDPDAPVARYLPEFAAAGKDAVTIRQVMTHTGGFPNGELNWPAWQTREARLAAYAGFELEYAPGTRYHYHHGAGAWVLADVMHAVTGADHRDFLRTSVFTPLGLAGVRGVSLGEPVAEQHAVLTHRFALSDETRAKLPPHFQAAGSELPGGLGVPEGRAAGFPGAGAVATAQGMAQLYQDFLHDPHGLWDAGTLRLATRELAIDLPGRWERPVTRSLSMYLAGEPARRAGSEADFFGPGVSAAAFGHDGLGGNFVWADPESGLSLAFLTNTIQFMPFQHHPRASRISAAAARLLG